MTRALTLLAAASAAAAALACGPSEPQMQDFWHLDLEHGTEVAVQSGRPMLVVFR